MGLLDLFTNKKHKVSSKKSVGKQENLLTADIAPQKNEDTSIIMGQGLLDHKNSLLFYRKQWAGKGDSGIDWIILKHSANECQITYKQAYAGYGEGLPRLDNIKVVEKAILLDQLINWDYICFLNFLQKELKISLYESDCVTPKQYYQWVDSTNKSFLSETIIYKRPLNSCRGGVEPTDFIIKRFTNRIEIVWGVGWCGGTSHADGAGGSELLDADYFKKQTINDFMVFLQSKSWAEDFLKWFDLRNNEKVLSLFAEK